MTWSALIGQDWRQRVFVLLFCFWVMDGLQCFQVLNAIWEGYHDRYHTSTLKQGHVTNQTFRGVEKDGTMVPMKREKRNNLKQLCFLFCLVFFFSIDFFGRCFFVTDWFHWEQGTWQRRRLHHTHSHMYVTKHSHTTQLQQEHWNEGGEGSERREGAGTIRHQAWEEEPCAF